VSVQPKPPGALHPVDWETYVAMKGLVRKRVEEIMEETAPSFASEDHLVYELCLAYFRLGHWGGS
jgi:hypothetical protein